MIVATGEAIKLSGAQTLQICEVFLVEDTTVVQKVELNENKAHE